MSTDIVQPLRDAGWRVINQCLTRESLARFEQDWRDYRATIAVEVGDMVRGKINAEQVQQCIAWLDAYQVSEAQP